MKTLAKIWVYSNIHIAVIAFLLTLESNYILGITRDFKSPLFVFFSTLLIYNLGYYRVILFKGEAQRDAADWMKRHNSYWIFSILISLLAIIYILSAFLVPTQIAIGILSLISFLYILHDVNIGGISLSIRNIPLLKIFIVSGIWMLITILPQLIEYDLFSHQSTWKTLMAERFFFILPITLIFDIRDIQSDPINLKTVPKLAGIPFTKGLAIFSVLIGYIFYYLLNFPILINGLMLALYLVMVIMIVFSNEERGELYYSGWFDGLMGVHALIIICYYLV